MSGIEQVTPADHAVDVPVDVRPVAFQVSGACGDEDLAWSLMVQVDGAWVPVESGQDLLRRDPGQAQFSQPLAEPPPTC